MKILVRKSILTIVIMASCFISTNAQTDLMYKSTNNNLELKEQQKERHKLLAKVERTHLRNLDTFYNTIFNSPKRLRFEFGLNYGFVLGGKYNYETYKSGIKLEAKDVALKPNVCYGLKFNVYWPLVKLLFLQTGIAFGAEKFKVTTVNSYGVVTDENMETDYLCGNLGLLYNRNKLVVQNYFQFGQVFSPASGFFGNVTGVGFRNHNSMISINYRYSGGTLINVTQKSESSSQERSYSANAIFISYGYIGAILTPKEKAELSKMKEKYKSEKSLTITGKTNNINYQILPTQTNNIESPKESVYKELTDSTLKDLLQMALKKEEYEKADAIQTEINKRIQQNKYVKSSNEELKIQLENALKMEDYKAAEDIQGEIDKRNNLKKDNNTKTSNQKQSSKKSLNELEQDLKKAMNEEDYKKADEIQKEINKLKQP